MSALLVHFVEVSRKIHANASLQMHGECSVTKLPFLHVGLTQVHIVRLLFFFLRFTRLYFFCVRKEMWDTPADPLDESLAMNSIGFKRLISTDWPQRGSITIPSANSLLGVSMDPFEEFRFMFSEISEHTILMSSILTGFGQN